MSISKIPSITIMSVDISHEVIDLGEGYIVYEPKSGTATALVNDEHGQREIYVELPADIVAGITRMVLGCIKTENLQLP